MSINNPEAFAAGLWDFAVLDGCFGEGRIRPTDVDFLVERNGHFLFVETKSPGVAVPEGQRIMLEKLAQIPAFAVIIVWGRPGEPSKLKLMWRGRIWEKEDANLDILREWCSSWFRFADILPPRR